MFPRRLIFCLPILLLGGCSWLPYAVDNLNSSVADVVHEQRFQREARQLAYEAWNDIACSNEAFKKSKEYGNGFRAGFFDFLDCNGNADPPATPPRYLRSSILRNPDQQQDIIDWFAGFRHGAATAAEARWRERIVIPISLPPKTPDENYGEEIVPIRRQPRTSGTAGVAVFDPPGSNDLRDADNPSDQPVATENE
jgi:hypothetical protein